MLITNLKIKTYNSNVITNCSKIEYIEKNVIEIKKIKEEYNKSNTNFYTNSKNHYRLRKRNTNNFKTDT